MVKSPIETRAALTRGAFAGVTAGLVLTLMMTIMSATGGKDVWYGVKGAAAPFLHDRAMQPGFDFAAVLLGFTSHLVISAIWGMLFAVLVYGVSRFATVVAGVLWGIVVWIGMYYVVLPIVGLSSMQDDAPVARAIAFHLFFSAAMTGAYFLYPRLFGHRTTRQGPVGRWGHVV